MTCPACAAETEASSEVCFQCGHVLSAVRRGSVIANRYEVLHVLGRGGMGVVYKAHDRLLDEDVAIKVLRRDLLSTPEAARRFMAEIKLARKVSHPSVCRIHEYGEDAGLSFISMAFVEGQDLRQRLLEYPTGLPLDEVFDVAIRVALGLHAIHEAGIIHRDFKTPNVMREASGAIRLMDFGVAKESVGRGTSGLTEAGSVVGTPEFMSPEQCRGEAVDARTDIYSLGIMVFELFTGDVPFRGETLMATLFKHIQEPPPFDSTLAARIPAEAVSVLRRALAKTPTERYATAADFGQAMEQARSQWRLPTRATPSVVHSSDRRRTTRLETPLSVLLKRTSVTGSVLEEERTVADNIGRRGLRVMTSLSSLVPGETVLVEELDGDFSARAVVRHRSTPSDGIPRLGLEFVDREAPDRLVLTGDWTSAVSRSNTPRSSPGAARASDTASSRASSVRPDPPPRAVTGDANAERPWLAQPPGGQERRSSSRITIPLEVVLERLSAHGAVLQQERTLAENVGRQGARVLTAMHAVAAGEVLRLRELGGDFETRATVRNAYIASDRVRRLNLEFLDQTAPDRLVPVAAGL